MLQKKIAHFIYEMRDLIFVVFYLGIRNYLTINFWVVVKLSPLNLMK